MELRQVRYFVAVAEELHFGRAADKIGIAQPALSQQIKQLETELGGELLMRTKRKVLLTDAGKLFLEQAKSLLAHTEYAESITRRAFSGLLGKMVIGFVESATWDILPRILSAYNQKYPDVKVVIRKLNTHEQSEALKNHSIDVGISGFSIEDPALCIRTVRQERYWVALPKGHRLSGQVAVCIADLKNEKFIASNRETGRIYFDMMVQTCMSAGFSPQIVQTADELSTMLSLVSCGMGIALIHESVKNYRPDLVYKPLEDVDTIAYQLSFAWRKEDTAPTLSRFVQEIDNLYPNSSQ